MPREALRGTFAGRCRGVMVNGTVRNNEDEGYQRVSDFLNGLRLKIGHRQQV